MYTLETHKTCLKCKHTRTPQDAGPDYACPQCGSVYAKLEAAARATQQAQAAEAARRQDRIEQEEWEKANADEIRRARSQASSNKALAHVTYLMYVLPLGITAIIGVVLAYVLGSKAQGSWVESHGDWLARTFWVSLFGTVALSLVGWMALGGTLLLSASRGNSVALMGGMGMAMFIKAALVALGLWYIYRVAKGWFYLFREDAIA